LAIVEQEVCPCDSESCAALRAQAEPVEGRPGWYRWTVPGPGVPAELVPAVPAVQPVTDFPATEPVSPAPPAAEAAEPIETDSAARGMTAAERFAWNAGLDRAAHISTANSYTERR
jgi:hypothetical protein